MRDKNKYYGTKLYNIWAMMKRRCDNKSHFAYKWYGGRGVKVCDEWMNDSIKFCDWAVLNGYEEGLTLDRIDNNGDYSPDNCQWITNSENCGVGKRRCTKNTSGFVGVWFDKQKGKWRAEISINCKKITLGSHDTIESAIDARIQGEIKYLGERKTFMST
jgi:hypothetical protein